MKRELLNQLQAARAAKTPTALVTVMASGAQYLLSTQQTDIELAEETVELALQALRDDRSGVHETANGKVFIQIFNPPLRMIIVGAVHITQTLVPMARLAGYDVVVIDPRRAWTSGTRFPDVRVSEQWPDDALAELDPDSRTAIVTLSHDPKLDDPALHIALRSSAFYIGSLGSKRTHAKRLERLHEAGFDDQLIGRIHAPIGLNISAKSPAEIAVSIMAQVTQARYQVTT